MLSLSKRVDYALIALAHLAERPGRVSPAREIAEAYDLPLPLLMNILKELNQSGWVRSSRGTKGGYEIGIDPKSVSLHDLIIMLEGPVQTTECVSAARETVVHQAAESCTCERDDRVHATTVASPESGSSCGCRVSRLCPVQAPLKALNDRLVRFLREVKLADIISPGRKVDVPLEMMGIG
jgi:Rrf2 family protein